MPRRPFVDTLRDVNEGAVLIKLDATMQELVQAVQRTRKGGKMTLVVDVTPWKESSEAVVVKASVTLKEPAVDGDGSIMFPTPEGNLTRTHPKQQELPIVQVVESPAKTA